MMLTPAPGGQCRWTESWLHPNIVCLVTSSALAVIITDIMSGMSDITVTEAAIVTEFYVRVSAQHGSATRNNSDS